MAVRMDILHGGRPAASLTVVDGEMHAEAKRAVTRNLDATMLDPLGDLTGSDIGDLLSPYDAEMAPWRGIVLPSGVTEWVPLGIFRMTGKGVATPGAITVAGQDRAVIYQGEIEDALAIEGNTPVEDVVYRLLARRNSGLLMKKWVTGVVVGPLLYPPDTDVWAAALELAESVGGWLAFDRSGFLNFGPYGPTSDTPLLRYAYGDGILGDARKTDDFDSIRNVVVAKSAAVFGGGVIQATVEDTNPLSPTYARGTYGRRTETIVNPAIRSVSQAKQVAATEWVRQMGRLQTTEFDAAPHLGLDPMDPVLVHYPSKGINERTGIVSSLTMPLTCEGKMGVKCYASRVAADGNVLEVMSMVGTTS